MNELIKIDSCILALDENSFTKLLLHGDGRDDNKTNKSIILASINVCLIISTNQVMRPRLGM